MGVGCAASVLRRIAVPAGLLVGTAAVVAGPVLEGRTEIGTVLVFTDLLYCAVVFPPWRTARAVAVAAGGVATVLGVVALLTTGMRTGTYAVLNLPLVVGLPLVWGLEVRRFRDLAAVERERAAAVEQTAARERGRRRRAERARMARDLHDVVAVGCRRSRCSRRRRCSPGADPALVRQVWGRCGPPVSPRSGRCARDRAAARRRHGRPARAPARLSEVDALLDEARAAGLSPVLHDERGADPLPAPVVDLAGYRIVQESLTNAAKHAPGSQVTVRLSLHSDAPGRLLVEVRNGPGRRPAAAPGCTAAPPRRPARARPRRRGDPARRRRRRRLAGPGRSAAGRRRPGHRRGGAMTACGCVVADDQEAVRTGWC
ncbi:hypothetical protein [Pseudonocardia sp. ICBG601]|uniref:hypothetical protein n=1 Tax=Pseudonocardia sp. ICBG601 TaxID=2846759 RepID=UPI001CF6C650|nr:hypothetical protein [Pseudonocardia sp. ICBG601]